MEPVSNANEPAEKVVDPGLPTRMQRIEAARYLRNKFGPANTTFMDDQFYMHKYRDLIKGFYCLVFPDAYNRLDTINVPAAYYFLAEIECFICGNVYIEEAMAGKINDKTRFEIYDYIITRNIPYGIIDQPDRELLDQYKAQKNGKRIIQEKGALKVTVRRNGKRMIISLSPAEVLKARRIADIIFKETSFFIAVNDKSRKQLAKDRIELGKILLKYPRLAQAKRTGGNSKRFDKIDGKIYRDCSVAAYNAIAERKAGIDTQYNEYIVHGEKTDEQHRRKCEALIKKIEILIGQWLRVRKLYNRYADSAGLLKDKKFADKNYSEIAGEYVTGTSTAQTAAQLLNEVWRKTEGKPIKYGYQAVTSKSVRNYIGGIKGQNALKATGKGLSFLGAGINTYSAYESAMEGDYDSALSSGSAAIGGTLGAFVTPIGVATLAGEIGKSVIKYKYHESSIEGMKKTNCKMAEGYRKLLEKIEEKLQKTLSEYDKNCL